MNICSPILTVTPQSPSQLNVIITCHYNFYPVEFLKWLMLLNIVNSYYVEQNKMDYEKIFPLNLRFACLGCICTKAR